MIHALAVIIAVGTVVVGLLVTGPRAGEGLWQIEQIPSMMQTNKKAGMVTMNDALLEVVNKKLVTPEDAWMKSVDKTGFEGMLKAKGHDLGFLKNMEA